MNEQEQAIVDAARGLAAIRERLARPTKLRRIEREQIETKLSNWFGSGDINHDEHRATLRALRMHE